ncbi:VWA domain-containing protein [Vannielia litorea]|uniref:Ca-activated chloride channel family protein n=1 Tax=Vannielia litorea TaxID=1217970 RepID=A0A1N6H9R5_9RHOB|nr:VWA domain-containing protein [Vannielia litorea]SIO16480.1 Ca-activated chloride channel family protein [Vannielia litorea]
MTDEFDKLKKAMQAAPPAPDPEAKKAALALAMQAFDDSAEKNARLRQGLAKGARPTPESPREAGLMQGVRDMFAKLSTKAGLAATTGIAAAGLAAVVIIPQMQQSGGPTVVEARETKGAAATDSTRSQAEAAPLTQPETPQEAPEIAEVRSDDAQAATPAPEPAATEDVAVMEEPPMAEAEADEELAAEAPLADAVAGASAPTAPRTATAKRSVAASAARERAETGGIAGIVRPEGVLAPAPAPGDGYVAPQDPDTEAFPEAEQNPVKVASEEPVSTFSIDVDTASYSVVRSSLNAGRMPPVDAVRVEEMVNYFPYAYAAPEADDPAPFKPTVVVGETPWNPDTRLVTVAIQGELPLVEDRPPLNLVFLVDSSGSMSDANKLPLLKQSLRLMLPELRPEDQVAIVAYAGSSGLVLPPTPASERGKILAALDNVGAGGSTAGHAGLEQAYAVAEEMTGEGEISRVLLATDGDFNVGLSSPEDMKEYIEKKRESGTFLSVLGFGRGNLDDALMQALAQNGNGQAAYIDTLNEARKVLVDQFTGALFPIASDVKIQVEFNPAEVAEYRLIGYETRALRREDFNNDKVDAGEIGAGHSVTAIYEITPVGSPAVLNDPLRYGSADASVAPAQAEQDNPELAFLRMRWKEPGDSESALLEFPITAGMGTASDETRFAAAIAGFGQLLKGSSYLGDWSYADAIALANGAKGTDEFGYRAEAVNLMRLAQSLSQ